MDNESMMVLRFVPMYGAIERATLLQLLSRWANIGEDSADIHIDHLKQEGLVFEPSINCYQRVRTSHKRGGKTMANNGWEERVGGAIFVFEKTGDSIEGKLVNIRKSGQYDNYVYDIDVNGELMSVFGTTMLNSRLSEDDVGKEVRIVFQGEKKSISGQNYKDFKIFVRG